jgi:hypothetical protein
MSTYIVAKILNHPVRDLSNESYRTSQSYKKSSSEKRSCLQTAKSREHGLEAIICHVQGHSK